MADIVQLHTPPVQEDIVRGLRNLADTLEQEGPGAYDMEVISTVHVTLGHAHSKKATDGSGDLEQFCHVETFVWGARTDPFTVRGMLSTVLRIRS